ncbi:hypothetical protein [Haloarchaeobius litoreus]|uniref:Phospholipase_D-nuclease N-terminal n=1 Tax=Haloarchaeobius litoreus TaxID=755306 RepID=A0ABD6DGG1_9EURY|nr:hypothetical protein [Haloarchaeobius litoreus]
MSEVALLFGLAIFVALCWACIAAWVCYDAEHHGRPTAAGLTFAVFLTGPPGLLAYLTFLSPDATDAGWP